MASKADEEGGITNSNAQKRLARLHPELVSSKGRRLGATKTAGSDLGERLYKAGLDSAHAIASMTRTQFLRKMAGGGTNGRMMAEAAQDDALAREVYQNAVNIKARAGHLVANIKDTIGSPHFRATAFYNVPDDTAQQFENMPSYRALFGRLDYCSCDHCDSIFSPAAYFLDLMRLIDQHITEENPEVPEGFKLEERRPDLFDLKLDCDNTNNMVPFLELVNSVLEQRLAKELDVKDVFRTLADARYPMNLPFNLPHAELRTYLEKLGTSLAEVIEAFSPSTRKELPAWRNPVTATSARERLGLSPEQAGLLTKPEPNKIAPHFGLESIDSFLQTFVPGTGRVDVADRTVMFKSTDASANIGDLILCNGEIRLVVGPSEESQIITDRPWSVEANGQDYAIAPMVAGRGKITIIAGSDEIQGTRTRFENLKKGDRIQCAGELRTIIHIQNDTRLQVDRTFPENLTNQAFSVDRSGALDHLDTLLEHLGLTHEEFAELLRQDLSDQEIAQGGLLGLF
ncbi:MAG: Tc toxin subunit A, partial [Pseudomonadota bacterium]